MRNYEKKISELGLDGKLSKNLNKLIKDFKDAENELPNLEAQIKNAESEEQSEELQKELDGLVEALNESDEELCHKIDIFFKNRDKYAELTKKMRDSRDAKLIAEGKPPIAYKNSTPQATQVAPKVDEPTPIVVTPTPSEPTTTITKSGGGETTIVTPQVIEDSNEEKKEKGFGNMLLWGALGFAGILIGVNLYKNRN